MELFGDVVYNLYGSTEVAVATVATPEDWQQAPGTVGRPPVGCTVRLYDERARRVTAPDTVGRVFVGSGLRFSGYTGGGSKEEIDGLLSSGDVGHFDADGLLFIDGRDDDMIVSGGENVFPIEIENLLVEHAAVADAAVIGVPDEEFGQRLKAFVVLRAGRVAGRRRGARSRAREPGPAQGAARRRIRRRVAAQRHRQAAAQRSRLGDMSGRAYHRCLTALLRPRTMGRACCQEGAFHER